ncbi:membrane-associated protein, putative [Bodo saltans]|uniref:Membrane-associated protein, putative n=1 Tax=Bodo saltans TaxID=75058 RepID=A0A0S4JTG6_BODSA|nr:membrane-associated protein, putative [Bodo saltans]|eukprot:CUG93573.1 membrane-associated protein, putative [Bodo saltans]
MIQRILPLLVTLVLVLFVRPLSGLVVTLDADTPTFVVANTVHQGSSLLELHVCPNTTECDPQTTDVNVLLDNVTFPNDVVVSVFGYAPIGEHTFSSWSPDGGSQQVSSPVGYTFTTPCPYRSLTFLIQKSRNAAAALIVFNGSFCNGNLTSTGVLSLNVNESSDLVFYDLVLRQSSVTLVGQRVGTVAVLGSILALAAGSTIRLLDLEARGTPWNATFAYLMNKNPEYFRGSLLPYFWQATHNSTSTTSITTLSPSLWLELGRSITVTNSSSLTVANNGVERTELRRGAVVVVGTALVSIPPTADTLITPFILVSQSSTITFLNAIMTSASNMSYQYGGALFIGPSQALVDDATIDTGSSSGLDVRNRNQSLQLVMVNYGSIVLQNCIVNTTASSSSAAIEINLHGVPRRQQQLSSTTVSGGAMWLENSSSVLLDNTNVQSSIAAGILINAINSSQFSILWSNASGVALKGGSVVTSNGTFGVALDCSASVSLMFFVVQNSFIDVTGGSIVSGRVAGLYINVNDAQNATLAILYGSRITASGTGTVVRGGVLQAASGGSGLLLSAIRSTNTSLTMDNAALGAITGGRCSGTGHAVAIDASYSQQFQVAANNTAVIGARSCGVLEVSVPLPLSSPGNSTLLMSLLQAEDASVILNGNSIVGVLGFPTLTCSTTVTVSGSGLVATAVLPDSIFGPSYSMAAVDFFASFSVRTRLIINTTSVIGVVGPLAGLLIGLGNQPNASLVAVNFDDSIGCTVVISGPSGIGLVDGLNVTLLPTRGIVTRGSTVVFTSVRAAVLQADLSDGAIIGVSDATATSSDGRILLWNMAASTNSAVAIGSGCTVGALFRLQSCIITDKATGSVTKSNNLTASTFWEIVRVALTNASGAMVTVKGPGAALGVTSTDCTSTLPITVKTSSIVKSAALLRVDASYSTMTNLLISSGGTLGVTLGLAGQQSVQITKEWVLLDFRDSSLATVFVSDDNSVVGVWSTTYRATQLSSTFGTGLMYVYGSMSNALSILVKDGATWGVTRVTAPDAAQIASPALACVYIDLQQSNSTTVQVSGPNSLYGVGNSNLSLRYTGNANTFYLSCNFTQNASILVSSGAVMGVINSLVKGVWNVNIRFASSVGLSLIVDANARVGSVNTTIGPYGAVSWTCTSAVNMSIAITSNSSMGILDNSVFILAPPYPSPYGLLLDLTTTVGNSLILAGSSCFGLCDGVSVQGISTAVGFTLSASVGASITADDHSVIGVRGINTFVNATIITQLYAQDTMVGLLMSVSRASVFGAADHCVLIATNTQQKGAISILYVDSKGTTILASEGSVVGVRNNVTLTSLFYGLYLGGYTDSNFFANFTDNSVYGFVDCSQIRCAYASVTAYAYAAFHSSIRFSNQSTFGAVNSTLTTEQGTTAVYYGSYSNATAPVVQFSEGSVLGLTHNSVSYGAIMTAVDTPTIGGALFLFNTGSVLGATRNSSVVGLGTYSVFVQPALCVNFNLFIWNRSVVGVSDGGVIRSTLAATQGVTLYAYGASNMVVSILGGSAFGVLPICPFGPNSSVTALLDTCVSRASSFRRSYITPFPMVYISLSTTFSSFLTVQDSSLIGIASLPWPQTNGAGDNVCTNATDQHPCPLTKTSITALVWVEAQSSFSATISVLDGSCVGICVEARPPEFDVSDELLRGYLLLPNSTYFTLQWVTLSLKSAQSTTVTLRNDSTFGARLENAFQDPGYLACVSPSPKRFALLFVVIDGLGTRNALIQVSQRSSFAVVFRVDAVIFQSSASQILVNFTGAFGPQIIISNESSLAETRLVAPQFPKPMTWPSPSCSAYESNKTLFTTTGLYNGVINSATYFPNNAALIYITLTSVTIGTVSITDGSHLSLITTSGDDYVSNARYNRSVTSSLWATTFVTQGCAMLLDVSRSVYMQINVSGSSSSGGSSVLGIYGN